MAAACAQAALAIVIIPDEFTSPAQLAVHSLNSPAVTPEVSARTVSLRSEHQQPPRSSALPRSALVSDSNLAAPERAEPPPTEPSLAHSADIPYSPAPSATGQFDPLAPPAPSAAADGETSSPTAP